MTMPGTESIRHQKCQDCGESFVVYKRDDNFVCAGCYAVTRPPRRRVVEITSRPKAWRHPHGE